MLHNKIQCALDLRGSAGPYASEVNVSKNQASLLQCITVCLIHFYTQLKTFRRLYTSNVMSHQIKVNIGNKYRKTDFKPNAQPYTLNR